MTTYPLARKGGLAGPLIEKSLQTIHARETAKAAMMGSFKHGGKVKKTGLYKLHAGETVVPAKKKSRKSHPSLNY